MKRCLWSRVFISIFLFCFSACTLSAQEEKIEYAYGQVINISESQIIVGEYDDSLDKIVDITYTVDPKTKLENLSSLKEIARGDNIEIDYVINGSSRVAMFISKEKLTPEELSAQQDISLEILEDQLNTEMPVSQVQPEETPQTEQSSSLEKQKESEIKVEEKPSQTY